MYSAATWVLLQPLGVNVLTYESLVINEAFGMCESILSLILYLTKFMIL